MEYKIPLYWPYMNEDIKKSVLETLGTRWLGQGPQVNLFEKEYEEKFGVNYAVSVNSGSAALETAYDLIGIEEGDEVLVPVLTCTATNIPLLRKKAKLVFLDIDPLTLCPSAGDAHAKITGKTKAIVIVHLGGILCPLGQAEYDGRRIPIVADACQALGLFQGDYTANSFQAIKFFTTGDGGMLACPNEAEYREAKLMRWFGIDREKKRAYDWQAWKERETTYDIELLGYKRQMTDIAAAMGRAGLRAYDGIIAHRRKLFAAYRIGLRGTTGIELIDGEVNLCWTCTVLVERRDDFARMLKEKGIETNLGEIRNDIYQVFGGRRQDLPNMNSLEDQYLKLPINPKVTVEDVEFICETIRGGW